MADKPQLSGVAESLRHLAAALESGTDRDRWAQVGLFAAFSGENAVRPARPALSGRRGWLRALLEYAPSVFVFLPILITWSGLTAATVVYRRTLHDSALEGQPFLQRWEGGFDGHLWSFLTLDWFAAATVIALFTLLTTSLLDTILTRRAERAERDACEGIRAELTAALVAADLELAVERSATSAPGSPAAELGKVVGEIDRVTAELDRMTAVLGETATKIKDAGSVAGKSQQGAITALQEVRAATHALEQAAVAVQDATGQADQAATKVGDELSRTSTAYDRLATVTATASQQISQSGDRVGTRLADVAADFGDRMRELNTDAQKVMANAVDSSANQIAAALTDGTVHVRDALVDIRTTGAAYTDRVEAASDVLGRAQNTIESMGETARLLERRLAAVNSTEDRVVTVLGELRTTLDAASRTVRHTTQDELLQAITTLTSSVNGLNTRLAAQRPATPPQQIPVRGGWWGRIFGGG